MESSLAHNSLKSYSALHDIPRIENEHAGTEMIERVKPNGLIVPLKGY
jgi:hypothetical protein